MLNQEVLLILVGFLIGLVANNLVLLGLVGFIWRIQHRENKKRAGHVTRARSDVNLF